MSSGLGRRRIAVRGAAGDIGHALARDLRGGGALAASDAEHMRAHKASPEVRDEAEAKLDRIPLGGFGAPKELVEACRFLLTRAADCTCSLLTVDCDYSLGMPHYADRDGRRSG